MPDATLEDTYVVICDWRGRVIWISGQQAMTKPGDFIWEHLLDQFREEAKSAFARVVTLREETMIESQNKQGRHLRSWMWPLESPDVAVCILTIGIPQELSWLTPRERETLGHVALGRSTREIAEKMDVSVSTVHTHLRRSREKLSLRSGEALTGFAARYCHPKTAPMRIG